MRKDANQLSCEEFQRQMAELVSSGVDIEDLYASFVRKLVRSFLLLAAVLIFGANHSHAQCVSHTGNWVLPTSQMLLPGQLQ
jgi:hypothetical protein